jgi:hypothetical protein
MTISDIRRLQGGSASSGTNGQVDLSKIQLQANARLLLDQSNNKPQTAAVTPKTIELKKTGPGAFSQQGTDSWEVESKSRYRITVYGTNTAISSGVMNRNTMEARGALKSAVEVAADLTWGAVYVDNKGRVYVGQPVEGTHVDVFYQIRSAVVNGKTQFLRTPADSSKFTPPTR